MSQQPITPDPSSYPSAASTPLPPNAVFPPPIVRVVERADATNAHLPGEIQFSETGELLKVYLGYSGFTDDLLSGFNAFLTQDIPTILSMLPINLPDGRQVRYSNAKVEKPYMIDITDDKFPLFPTIARTRDLTYEGMLYADMTLYNADGTPVQETIRDASTGATVTQPATRSRIEMGKIPIMLGSVACHLHNRTPQEKESLLEDAVDPLSYFIIRGQEKVILTQEKLRFNRPFLYNKEVNGNPIGRMTCATPIETALVQLSQSERQGIRLSLRSLLDRIPKKEVPEEESPQGLERAWELKERAKARAKARKDNTLPVFHIYKLLAGLETDEVVQRITRFTKKGNERKIWFALVPSKYEAEAEPLDITDPVLIQKLTIDLFPQMNENDVENKLNLLDLMVCQYAEFLVGLRKVDDRDNWSNKQMVTASASMRDLFVWLVKAFNEAVLETVKGRVKSNFQNVTIDTIVNSRKPSIIRDGFVDSFGPNNWGPKRKKDKQNITEPLRRDGIQAIQAHINQINVPTSRQMKNPKIRNIHASQWRYVCTVASPEGSNAGLVKCKALTCRVSVHEDDTPIIRYLQSYIRGYASELSPCIVNGRFLGWCDGPATREMLIQKRRLKAIAIKAVIVLDPDNVLYVYTDAGRPTAPLLTVISTPEGDQLVLERENLQVPAGKTAPRGTFDRWLSKGAVEFIDPWEHEYTDVAQQISDLRRRKTDVEQANSITNWLRQHLQALESLIYRTPAEARPILEQFLLERTLSGKVGTMMGQMTRLSIRLAGEAYPAEATTMENFLEKTFGPEAKERGEEVPWRFVELTDDQYKRLLDLTIATMKENLQIAESKTQQIINYYRDHPLTHCEMDPNAIFGVVGALIPYANRNVAARNTYQISMGKQALGVYHSNHPWRFDTTAKMLAYPTPSLFETEMYSQIGLNTRPAGQMCIIAFMPYEGYNQEDSFVFKKSSIDRGMFTYIVYRRYRASLTKPTGDIKFKERFEKPTPRSGENTEKYRHLDESGVAKIGSHLKEGDVVISKTRRDLDGKIIGIYNTTLSRNEAGYVEAILKTVNEKKEEVVKVKLRDWKGPSNMRRVDRGNAASGPVIGDKFAFRYSQKGTIGLIVPDEDMPFTQSGMKPDVLANTHSLPSRMTIGWLIEVLTSKYGALVGERINASSFNQVTDISEIERQLTLLGYQNKGYETLYSGHTGKRLQAKIFIGPCYIQTLRHMVDAKIQFRSRGAIRPVTRQPVGGRSKIGGGAIRFGEMETFNLISHGASAVMQDRLFLSSDPFKASYCETCGIIGISNLSRIARQENHAYCPRCDKEGKIGTCTVPSNYKLLRDYLVASGLNLTFGFRKVAQEEVIPPMTPVNPPPETVVIQESVIGNMEAVVEPRDYFNAVLKSGVIEGPPAEALPPPPPVKAKPLPTKAAAKPIGKLPPPSAKTVAKPSAPVAKPIAKIPSSGIKSVAKPKAGPPPIPQPILKPPPVTIPPQVPVERSDEIPRRDNPIYPKY